MIPKIIHYCWFGNNPLPPLAVKCIDSWRTHCPDYEIKEWNENNFDMNMARYSKEAAEVDKWAFVADVVRFYVIYNYGGIYLDVDVELLKPLDEFLDTGMFIGFESATEINTGQGFGAEKNFYLVKKMQDIYTDMPFINPDDSFNTTPSPKYTSKIMSAEGFLLNNTKQTIDNIDVYPTEYFCPKDWRTNEIDITPNTHTIHHFLASWWTEEERQQLEANYRYERIVKRYRRANQID